MFNAEKENKYIIGQLEMRYIMSCARLKQTIFTELGTYWFFYRVFMLLSVTAQSHSESELNSF